VGTDSPAAPAAANRRLALRAPSLLGDFISNPLTRLSTEETTKH